MPELPIPCPGPGCDRFLADDGPLPDFCCYACANRWAACDHPTVAPIDHGAGSVKGASYSGGMAHTGKASNILSWAPPWLDARPHPDDEADPS